MQVTLSSGRVIEVDQATGAEISTSNGAVTTQPTGDSAKGGQLLSYMNGGVMRTPDQVAAQIGKFSRLWSIYVAPSRQWTQARVTGAEVGLALCTLGYLEFMIGDQTYKAGTNQENLPDLDLVRAHNPAYKAVKPLPSSREFFELVKAMRQK